MPTTWAWPGSRWWKCDLHLHTPGSYDFQDRVTVTPEAWVAAARARGLDAVAVTDHNTGANIDAIKRAAALLEPPLIVFPGVELTVQGTHLLMLFDPALGQDVIAAFLGRCGIPHAQFGAPEANAPCSVREALEYAREVGALCIAAHADEAKGIVKELGPGQTLMSVVTSEDLHGVETVGHDPEVRRFLDNSIVGYRRPLGALPLLTGSDGHALDQIGRRTTWIKMTDPNLEGLRLALQDGPDSVRPSADAAADPNAHAPTAIEAIAIGNAQYLGRPRPLEVRLNPWLNAIIGGRGAGKSSLIEFLRLALGREDELPPKLRQEFQVFKRVGGRTGDGGQGLLTEETSVVVTYRKDGARFRIHWRHGWETGRIEHEQAAGVWVPDEGAIPRRFPIRIYSQKEIFELANDPRALLRIVDDAPSVDRARHDVRWRERESQFLALRARSRHIEAALAEEGTLRGELADTERKIAMVESDEWRDVLREYQRRRQQQAVIDAWEGRFRDTGTRLRELAEGASPSALAPASFNPDDGADSTLLADAGRTVEGLAELGQRLQSAADEIDELVRRWAGDVAASAWRGRCDAAALRYQEVVDQLRHADVADPDEYKQLVERQQALERRLAAFAAEREALATIRSDADAILDELLDLRRSLSQRRAAFFREVLGAPQHVRIEVVPYGDQTSVEAEFRARIGREMPTFQQAIWSEDREHGLLAALYTAHTDPDTGSVFEQRLASMKQTIRDNQRAGMERRFAAHLAALAPEVHDRLDCWFPEDALRVTYSPTADGHGFRSIERGSPGQKTAAMLAFLLSYGREPVILDQPEDDLDNQLLYELIVKRLKEEKIGRQIIVVTHNPNIVVNGDAELVVALGVSGGQTRITRAGGLQEASVREEICRIMEGGRRAFEYRYRRIGGPS